MKIIDITMSIRENMPVLHNKADKKPLIWIAKDFKGGSSRESRVDLHLHTGTHIDAPLHLLSEGLSVDQIDLKKLIVPCTVIDCTSVTNSIQRSFLMEKSIEKGRFILLKTQNSFVEHYQDDYVYLDKDGAQYLKELEVAGVGIDALRIDPAHKKMDTHRVLFEGGIVLLEGLRLKEAEEKNYWLYALPLKLQGVEASPVRAILVDEES